MKPIHLTIALCLVVAAGDAAAATAFPDEAATPSSNEVQERLAGKIIKVKLADGSSWRLDYRANGYFFINTSSGFSDTGEWRTEDGKLCSKGRKISPSCNEVRVKDDALYLKRDSGEVVQFVVQ